MANILPNIWHLNFAVKMYKLLKNSHFHLINKSLEILTKRQHSLREIFQYLLLHNC